MTIRGTTRSIGVAVCVYGFAAAPAGAQSPPAQAAPPTHRGASPPPRRAGPSAASSVQPRVGPLSAPGAQLQPFGPGTPVEVTTPGSQQVTVYVARAADLEYRPADWEFVKIGRTPLTFELPPQENYWLEVESPEVTRGSLLLRVDREPKRLLVRAGSSDMGSLGSLSLAVGGLVVVAATAILISGTSGESGIDKPQILIPMYAAGAALLAGGVGLYFASQTDVEDPSRPEAASVPRGVPRTDRLPTVVAGIRFQF